MTLPGTSVCSKASSTSSQYPLVLPTCSRSKACSVISRGASRRFRHYTPLSFFFSVRRPLARLALFSGRYPPRMYTPRERELMQTANRGLWNLVRAKKHCVVSLSRTSFRHPLPCLPPRDWRIDQHQILARSVKGSLYCVLPGAYLMVSRASSSAAQKVFLWFPVLCPG